MSLNMHICWNKCNWQASIGKTMMWNKARNVQQAQIAQKAKWLCQDWCCTRALDSRSFLWTACYSLTLHRSSRWMDEPAHQTCHSNKAACVKTKAWKSPWKSIPARQACSFFLMIATEIAMHMTVLGVAACQLIKKPKTPFASRCGTLLASAVQHMTGQ